MKPNIFIARKLPQKVEAYLKEHCECTKWEGEETITSEQLLKAVSNVEGLLVTGSPIDQALLNAAPKLRAVSNLSVGYNNFDLSAMKARKIIGTNTPYVLDETVADLAFALILSTARRVAELNQFVKEGKWESGQDAELFGVDVHHATLGIIGMGRIGEAVARRAKLGFLMDVVYYNRRRKLESEQKLDLTYCSLESLLQRSDFVLLLTPLTTETRHLMDYAQFALMKKKAIFINVSRGENVNEKALVEALQAGKIYGAGLDVFEHEPIAANHSLLQFDNVVTLPHLGSATEQTRFDMAMAAAKNLVEALTGSTIKHVVPELL
ncbi:MAG: 2-ketogluconate reductase [Bacilli bacterium]|nr:2-ketogluconate reductase [Bacilli bacterium]